MEGVLRVVYSLTDLLIGVLLQSNDIYHPLIETVEKFSTKPIRTPKLKPL
jgi:hypothetical protein